MRVAFFSDALASRHGFGLGRYAKELFHALQNENESLELLPVSSWSNLDQESLRRLRRKYNYRLLPWGRRWTSLSWALLKWPRLEDWMGERIDLVHHVELSYPIATRKPWVVTIHDIGPLTHPELFSRSHPWLKRMALLRAVREAEALICVSQATAQEVRKYVGQPLGERLHVIPEGVSPQFFLEPHENEKASLRGHLPEGVPFILAVGSINPRKNLSRVVEALELITNEVPHHLVLVGARGWDSDETWRRIRTSSVADKIHFLGYVTDSQLNVLYHTADVFLYPSLYEGFGLPVLEAMAAGCPVVTSTVSSLPQVAENAALLVEPTDVSSMAEALLRIIQDRELASEMSLRGKKRVSDFTWEKCAQQVNSIYEDVGRR